MGSRYKDLKEENRALKQALQGFVSRLKVKPGDLLVFQVEPRYIGMPFGVGWGAMETISNMLSTMVGGAVRVMATTERKPFDVAQLDSVGRQKLRKLLDSIDRFTK